MSLTYHYSKTNMPNQQREVVVLIALDFPEEVNLDTENIVRNSFFQLFESTPGLYTLPRLRYGSYPNLVYPRRLHLMLTLPYNGVDLTHGLSGQGTCYSVGECLSGIFQVQHLKALYT